MRFILTEKAKTAIETIRKQYQQEKNVNLNEKPSLLGVPTLFGGTDVENREKQIAFLEKIHDILKPNLFLEEMKSPEQLQAYLTASRFMIAACLYVQSQISGSKRHSVLYRLIEDNLGITTENYLDEEDKEICFLAAKRMISSSPKVLDEANGHLSHKGIKMISEKEWRKFSEFINEHCNTSEDQSIYSQYPIASMVRPLFGAGFAYSGATIGLLLGDTISNASYIMGPKARLTAMVGTTLLVVGQSGPTSIALFGPVIATKLLNSFCTISLAHILGKSMEMLGQGIGLGVGLPLDLAYKLIWRACALIGNYYTKQQQNPELSGYRLTDGVMVIHGIVIQILPESQIPKAYKKQVIEIKEDNKMYIDGLLIEAPMADLECPNDVIEDIKKQIQACYEKQPIEEDNELSPNIA